MTNYIEIILAKYPAAVVHGPGMNVVVESGPDMSQAAAPTFDENGVLIPPDNSNLPIIARITMWELPDPQPTLEELEAYAATPEFQETRAIPLKAAAEARVNEWANQMVMAYKILEPELFYVAMVANVAFRLLEWNNLGKPEEVDPTRFIVTHAEARAYREAHAGQGDAEETMTPADLLRLQEERWNQMQQGFAAIVEKRRLALEKIKLAQPGESLPDALVAILAGLGTAETIP